MTDHPLLARVRAIALALPETEERPSHGQPTFFVAGKQFAQFRDDHHGDGLTVVCLKVAGADDRAALIEHQPDRYARPAYLGEDWVSLMLADDVDWDHVADRVAVSWELAAPRALLEAGGR
jgi:hypothetical protein